MRTHGVNPSCYPTLMDDKPQRTWRRWFQFKLSTWLVLVGMSQQQVSSLLGPADDTDYFRNWDMVYWLGPERGFLSIDSEWLVLRLDEQKRVNDFAIVRD